MKTANPNSQRRSRRAASTVEFALTIPVFLMVVFGGIEFARVCVVRHTCSDAALEAARKGILPGATVEACENEALRLMSTAAIFQPEVDVSPTVIDSSTESVTITVSAPFGPNGFVIARFFLGHNISQSVTLTREKYIESLPPPPPPPEN